MQGLTCPLEPPAPPAHTESITTTSLFSAKSPSAPVVGNGQVYQPGAPVSVHRKNATEAESHTKAPSAMPSRSPPPLRSQSSTQTGPLHPTIWSGGGTRKSSHSLIPRRSTL